LYKQNHGGKKMKKERIKKWLVVGIVWLMIMITANSVTGTPQNLKDMDAYDAQPTFFRTTPIEKDLSNLFEQFQIRQALNAELNVYGIVSTSGSGRAIPILIKLPHLSKIKGFFIFGIIIYPGLSAMTTVWRLTNMTAGTVVDVGVGPHVVVFLGIGFATYKRIIFGGAGSMYGISIVQPFIFP
jgi:hypothetical protein